MLHCSLWGSLLIGRYASVSRRSTHDPHSTLSSMCPSPFCPSIHLLRPSSAAPPDNPEALAAVAAVDEAVKKLPPEEALSLHFMAEGGGGMRAPDEPPNWGQKASGLGWWADDRGEELEGRIC